MTSDESSLLVVPPPTSKPRSFARLQLRRLVALGIISLGLIVSFLILLAVRRNNATAGGSWGSNNNNYNQRWLWNAPLESPIHIDPHVNPILLLGLPKSGSEAIHHFLQCLQPTWKSQHYCCDGSNRTRFACQNTQQTCGYCIHDNWSNGRPALEHCGAGGDGVHIYAQIDVETQEPYEWFLPQHFALPLLQRDYPNAVWILNTRGGSGNDIEDDDGVSRFARNNVDGASRWARNILHWHSTTMRLFHTFDLDYYNTAQSLDETSVESVLSVQDSGGVTEQELLVQLERSYQRAHNATEHERRYQELKTVYHQHSNRVRDFARNYHHGGLFLEIHVDEKDAAKEPPYLTLARGLGFHTAEYAVKAKDCWKYDAEALDNDWMDLTLKV